jgi:hypothetical protein
LDIFAETGVQAGLLTTPAPVLAPVDKILSTPVLPGLTSVLPPSTLPSVPSGLEADFDINLFLLISLRSFLACYLSKRLFSLVFSDGCPCAPYCSSIAASLIFVYSSPYLWFKYVASYQAFLKSFLSLPPPVPVYPL